MAHPSNIWFIVGIEFTDLKPIEQPSLGRFGSLRPSLNACDGADRTPNGKQETLDRLRRVATR
jgi:hypothetical protein